MSDQHFHALYFLGFLFVGMAAAFDWRTGKIPDWLTLGVLVLAPFVHGARAHRDGADPVFEMGTAATGALLCAAIPFFFYRAGALGGADLKLFAAVGALLHPMMGLEVQAYAFVITIIVAPLKLAFEGQLSATVRGAISVGHSLVGPKKAQSELDQSGFHSFRIGPAVFAGVMVALYTHW